MAALAQETAELAARVAEECKSLRTLINANSPDLSSLNTSSTNNLVAAVNEVWTITQSGIEWNNIQSKPSTFTPSAHVHSWSDITSGVPTSFTPSAHKTSHATGGSDELTAADIGAAPTSHTHTASQISDSTTTGRSLMTAANASAARTTLGLGNAALATTSTGGAGSTDSGKVLAFASDGSIKTTKVTVQSSSGLTGLILNPPASSFATPTFVAGSYRVAATQSLTGVPDDISPPLDKTTPIDADEVVIRDSAASFVAKRLTFANLWTWILSKLGGNLTIGGTKTWSGQQQATGQSATNGTSLMTRDLGDTRFLLIQMTGAYRWSNAVGVYSPSHVGAGVASTPFDVLELTAGSNAAGSVAFLRSNIYNQRSWHRCTGTNKSVVDWSLRTIHCVKIGIISTSGTNTVARIMLGQAYTNTTAQDLAASDKGIGLKIIDGMLNVQVANATAVSTTSTGQTLADNREYDIVLDCAGDGNWNCYVNGVSVATGTGAPTGSSTAGNNALCMSITNGATAVTRRFHIIQQTSIQF